MPLTPEQEQKVHDWITAKVPELACPACQGTDFGLGAFVYGYELDAEGEVTSQGRRMPMIQVICKRCGHVDLFTTSQMELFEH